MLGVRWIVCNCTRGKAQRRAFVGGVLLLVLAVIMFILDPELRKRVLQSLVRIGLILGLIWLLMTNATNRAAFQELIRNSLIGGQAGNAAVQGAAPVIAPPEISPWVVFAVSFGIGLALILGGWSLYTHRRKPRAGLVMDEVANIARKALDELGTGHDWDDAIVGAYIRMNEVVNKERGLFRLPGNTPSEFGRRMERIGLPGEAVRTLTSLFEAVRYGGKSSSREDRDLAAAALSAILHSCGRNA